MERVRRTINLDHLFDYHIYLACHPDTKMPAYIGQSKEGIGRPFKHLDEQSHNEAVNQWVNALKKENKMPIIVILEYVNQEALLDDKEAFWIAEYTRLGYPLLNKITFKKRQNDLNAIENNEESDLKNIANVIKQYRIFKGIKQEQLSKEIKLSRAVISRLEQGDSTVTIKNLLKVLDYFNISLNVG